MQLAEKGDHALDTALKRLLMAFRQAGFQAEALPHLTPRELDVLRLAAAGQSNEEIAHIERR